MYPCFKSTASFSKIVVMGYNDYGSSCYTVICIKLGMECNKITIVVRFCIISLRFTSLRFTTTNSLRHLLEFQKFWIR